MRASDSLVGASDSPITRFLFARRVAPGRVFEDGFQWNPDVALDDLEMLENWGEVVDSSYLNIASLQV